MSFPTPDAPFCRYAEADLPTEYGTFRVVVYREAQTAFEHLALVRGEVRGADDVLTRVHSECLTGEVLHSLKCDCREQLDLALRRIAGEERGVVLYLRQEGRGIGLGNKIRAYAKQSQGYDTVDANRVLGFEDDLRTYEVAAFMLQDLGVASIQLLTNNPAKITALEADGVRIARRVAHVTAAHGHNRDCLSAKQARMGHLYQLAEPALEQDEQLERSDADGPAPR